MPRLVATRGAAGAVAALVAVAGLTACQAEDRQGIVSAPATASVPATSATSADPAPATTATAGPSGAAPSSSATRTLPNLVGKGLQLAQDEAQAAGFFNLTSHDVKGRDRLQVWDRNWKVCTQSPGPGLVDPATKIDFGVAKIEEDCAGSLPTAGGDVRSGAPMPDLTGRGLKVADDALPRNASVRTEDVSGQDRVVLMRSNWKVCSQAPAAGTAWTGQPITLGVVKVDETCPRR